MILNHSFTTLDHEFTTLDHSFTTLGLATTLDSPPLTMNSPPCTTLHHESPTLGRAKASQPRLPWSRTTLRSFCAAKALLRRNDLPPQVVSAQWPQVEGGGLGQA